MTLDFAIAEATRRTQVLQTTHYVYPMGDEYIVTARVLGGRFPKATVKYIAQTIAPGI
jgi:hypothetical protein